MITIFWHTILAYKHYRIEMLYLYINYRVHIKPCDLTTFDRYLKFVKNSVIHKFDTAPVIMPLKF